MRYILKICLENNLSPSYFIRAFFKMIFMIYIHPNNKQWGCCWLLLCPVNNPNILVTKINLLRSPKWLWFLDKRSQWDKEPRVHLFLANDTSKLKEKTLSSELERIRKSNLLLWRLRVFTDLLMFNSSAII